MYLKRQKIGGANQIHVVFSFSICFGLSEHYAVFSMPLFLSFNPGMLGIYLDIFVKLKCVHIKTHKCQGNHCIDCTWIHVIVTYVISSGSKAVFKVFKKRIHAIFIVVSDFCFFDIKGIVLF